MATELQTKTETKQERSIFTGSFNFSERTEYKRPAFKEINFDDVADYTQPTTVATIEKQQLPQIQQRPVAEVKQQEQQDKKVKLNAHGKIIIAVVAVVVCALMAFAIGNAVMLSSLGSSVAAKQQYVATQQQTVADLEQQFNDLNNNIKNEASDKFGYSDASDANVIELERVDTIYRAPAQIETNWFDKLCNFFSGLFN